jgi:phosphate-selective porin O/P
MTKLLGTQRPPIWSIILGFLLFLHIAAPTHAQEPTRSPETPTTPPPGSPATGAIAQQRSMVGPAQPSALEDVLLEKGVLTTDDWIRIKAKEEQRAQETTAEIGFISSPRWYERIRVSGYIQNRYALLDNPMMDIPLGDRVATTDPNTFYIRRIRMVFQGQISDRLSFYFQPAFEGGQVQNLANTEIVDAFADFYITKDKEHRIRFGQHRVPNAFDTYRSSSNRQELDRHESIQSGAPGERDLGLAYYWSPKISQIRYAQLATYHNGPGDYGDFGIMVYNGQGRNRPELNYDKHVGLRLAHPFELPNGRLLEAGMFAYKGQYVVVPGSVSRCPVALHRHDGVATGCQVRDERLTWYFWTPPQPWGLLMEYTLGRGPQRDPEGFIRETHLYGGYVQPYYTYQYSDVGMLTGYVRWGEYYGGIKTINGVDGRSRTVNVGLVWEPDTHWRFVAEWMFKNGLNTFQTSPGVPLTNTAPQAEFNANLFRLQAQWFFN